MFEHSLKSISALEHTLEYTKGTKEGEQIPLINPKLKKKEFDLTQFVVYIVGLSDGLSHLATLAVYYLFKDYYRMNPYQVSLVFMCTYIPFMLKPFIALITDSLSIFGMRRKPYLFLFSLLQCVSFMVLAFVDLSVIQAVVVLFLISLSTSFCSTVAEALIVESSMGRSFSIGAINVTEFMSAKAVGSLSVAYFSGYLLERISREQIFLTTALFPLLIFVASFYLKEKEYTSKKSFLEKLRELINFMNNPIFLGPFLYIFVYTAGPDYDDVFFYFCTNKLGFRPAFMGTLRLTYGLASLIGLLVYRFFLKNATLKKTLIIATLVSFPIYISPIMLTEQINTYFGISNEVFSIGGGFLIEAIAEIQLLPLFVITASLCHPGLEASIFATIVSIKNFGSLTKKGTSSLLTYLMNINSHNFNNLSLYIFICGLCLLLSLLAIPLIPDDDQIEELKNKHRATFY